LEDNKKVKFGGRPNNEFILGEVNLSVKVSQKERIKRHRLDFWMGRKIIIFRSGHKK